MDINVQAAHFAGPLDLLLHLVVKNEIDIYDIEISSLADQYFEYLEHTERDMDSMSSFIVMAAELLEIKSKTLLPKNVEEAAAALESRDELIHKLTEFKRFKELSALLKEKREENGFFFYKNPDYDVISAFEKGRPDIAEILGDVTLASLRAAFDDVLNRRERKTDKIRAGFSSITRDVFTIQEKVLHIKNMLTVLGSISFYGIFNETASKQEIIVTFLALLELIKQNYVIISQTDVFKDIHIYSAAGF